MDLQSNLKLISKEELMAKAKSVLDKAYCPYSKFPVGCAILYKDGNVIMGVNVENVSFGVTNCAERTALFYGVTQGYKKGDIQAIAVAGRTKDFLPPCNICRQVLVEFCEPHTSIYLLNESDEIKTVTLQDLAPYSFVSLTM